MCFCTQRHLLVLISSIFTYLSSRKIISKRNDERRGYSRTSVPADSTHFGCHSPVNPVTRSVDVNSWWYQLWRQARIEADVIRHFVSRNRNFSSDEFHATVAERFHWRFLLACEIWKIFLDATQRVISSTIRTEYFRPPSNPQSRPTHAMDWCWQVFCIVEGTGNVLRKRKIVQKLSYF